MKNRSKTEGIADAFLFVLVTLPLLAVLVTSSLCGGWNEGSMAGTCTVPAMEGFYNSLMGIFLLLAFGGFLIVGPIVLVLITISLLLKIGRYRRAERPHSLGGWVIDGVTCIPIFAIGYMLFWILG